MALPDIRNKLLKIREELTEGLRASEDWQPSYKASRETFKALLRHEAELETSVSEYLAALALRAPAYVDWAFYDDKLRASSDGVLGKSDAVWKTEQVDFTQAVIDAVEMLVATGGQAGQLAYDIDLGITPLSESVLRAARNQVAELVTGVTGTNRDLIRQSIRSSLARGETASEAMERIQRVISNPVRARMIAETETVNAYQTGLKNFAVESGAKTKEWEALAGACKVCSPVDGEKVKIDELFSNGKDRPSAHPRCRCGLIYGY